MLPARSALTLAAALAILPSCATRSAMSIAPADEAPLPEDVEGTLAALDRAEGDLLAAIGPAGGDPRAKSARETAPDQPERQGYGGAEPPTETAAPATAPPPPSTEQEARLSTEERGEASQGPCDTACRALSSMERTAAHLCGLTGDADARCALARDRVQRAVERVRDACPACARWYRVP